VTETAGDRVVLGLDGCPSGWVAVALVDGCVSDVRVVARIEEAVAMHRPSVVAVDMPVGLLDVPREADAAARAELPGRAASVFSAAARSVVEGWVAGRVMTHAEASALNVETMGVGLSQQAWRLVPKMAEVEALASAGSRLMEVHPELAFAVIAGAPLPRKRSWPGLALRRAHLERLGLALPDRFPGDTDAAPDDVVDAAVCAWVADGLASRARVRTVPAATRQRAHGHSIAIHVREP